MTRSEPGSRAAVRLSRQRIYALVREIPHGRVATYGQIAHLAGFPRHARQVGYAMAALTGEAAVPWHRVVNAQGEISPRAGGAETDQRARLEAEGVAFDAAGRIDLRRWQWRPDVRTRLTSRTARSPRP